jgi:maltose alpha-D-glucosyltransferase/alpha-amylase
MKPLRPRSAPSARPATTRLAPEARPSPTPPAPGVTPAALGAGAGPTPAMDRLLARGARSRARGFGPAPLGARSPIGIRTVSVRPRSAAAIEAAFEKDGPWAVLRGLTTKKDLADVKSMCREIQPERWAEIYVKFWDAVVEARAARPAALEARDAALPEDWFHEPFYYCYPQYFGTPEAGKEGGFDALVEQLDYLETLGIRNLYLLPHYESPMADGGYDVSRYTPRQSLGGPAAYARFMKAANARGFRVVTDAPFNHTSVEHPWFQALKKGDPVKSRFYLQVNGREKIGEKDVNGDIVSRYRDPDGTETELVNIFPDVDRSHHLEVESGAGKVQVYREFYPFQVDLDLRNPSVLGEIFELLGREANDGVLGKRTDAIAHWMKRPGTASDGLPETHGLQALLKSFLGHVAPGAIVMPEAVRSAKENARYAGVATEIAGRPRASEGDALFAFEMQGALREMLYLGTSTPFWSKVFALPVLPENATWVNLLGHHDETYLGFVSEPNRDAMRAHIEASGGRVYKNGMSAGARFADCLGHDPERVATAMFALYLTPGTPAVYYGAELGAPSQPEFALAEQKRHHATLKAQGVEVPFDKAYDPRDLQRGPIPASSFAAAVESKQPGVETVRRLNALRASRPALRDGLLSPLTNGHDSVLSMVRHARDPEAPGLVALANLSGEPRTLRLPVGELSAALGVDAASVGWVDLLEDGASVEPALVDAHLELVLPPYGRLLLDAV